MPYTKIFKTSDGTTYELKITYWLDSYEDKMRYRYALRYKAKGKRTFYDVPDTLHEYQYRALSMEQRVEHTHSNILRYITPEQLYEATLELWEQFKPTMLP